MAERPPLIECVVNINHSQHNDFIGRLVSEINVLDSKVVHIDRGEDAQRTVITIISPISKMGATLEIIYYRCSLEQDITSYNGNHPSAGIVDVVPFIPIRGIDNVALKAWVDQWAAQVSGTHEVPIIYYGHIASQPKQQHLSDIRRGGPDRANRRLQEGQLLADYGPSTSHPKLGISSWTIRDYMVAYNVSLNTEDIEIAKGIAKDIRKLRTVEERLHDVRVLGWITEEYSCVQISANLYDINKMTMKDFYDLVVEMSDGYKVDVLGSELIGMTLFKGMSEHCNEGNVDSVIDYLRLSCHEPFIKDERILEFVI